MTGERTGGPEPGYYPDPLGDEERWWDGSRWTQHTRRAAAATQKSHSTAVPRRHTRPQSAPRRTTGVRRGGVCVLAVTLAIAGSVGLHLAVSDSIEVGVMSEAVATPASATSHPITLEGVVDTDAGPVTGARIEVRDPAGQLLAAAVSGRDGRWRADLEDDPDYVDVLLAPGSLPEDVLVEETTARMPLTEGSGAVHFELALRDATLRELGSRDALGLRLGDGNGAFSASEYGDAHRARITAARVLGGELELELVATGESVVRADGACLETPDGGRYDPVEVEEISSDVDRRVSALRFAVPPAPRATFSYACGFPNYSQVPLYELAEPSLPRGKSWSGQPLQVTSFRVGERTSTVTYLVQQRGDDREPACMRTRVGELVQGRTADTDDVELEGWQDLRITHAIATFEVPGDEVVGLVVGCEDSGEVLALR